MGTMCPIAPALLFIVPYCLMMSRDICCFSPCCLWFNT